VAYYHCDVFLHTKVKNPNNMHRKVSILHQQTVSCVKFSANVPKQEGFVYISRLYSVYEFVAIMMGSLPQSQW
jgi:hypothetical protein